MGAGLGKPLHAANNSTVEKAAHFTRHTPGLPFTLTHSREKSLPDNLRCPTFLPHDHLSTESPRSIPCGLPSTRSHWSLGSTLTSVNYWPAQPSGAKRMLRTR